MKKDMTGTGTLPSGHDTPRRSLSPRLKDLEYEIVSARIPREQSQWLQQQAAIGFRGRGDQIAFLINEAYEQRREP